jgi:hypothetical protein
MPRERRVHTQKTMEEAEEGMVEGMEEGLEKLIEEGT